MYNIFAVVILVITAIVAGCPPPFNSFKYLGNDTHTTADIVRALHPGVEGWTEVVSQVDNGPQV